MYGTGKLTKYIIYEDNQQPSNNEVFLGATKAFIDGYLGGRMGHKATQTTNLYFPHASRTTNVVSDSKTSSSIAKLLHSNQPQNSKQDKP